MTLHIREPAPHAIMLEGELLVIEAEQVEEAPAAFPWKKANA